MFGLMKLAMGGAGVVKTVLIIASLIAAVTLYMTIHDKKVETRLVDKIEKIEKGIKNEDIKKIKESDAIVDTRTDCDKLSIVYNSDQCETGQGASGDDIPEADIAEKKNIEGDGFDGVAHGEATMSMGDVLRQEEKRSLQSKKINSEMSLEVNCDSINKWQTMYPDCHILCATDFLTGKESGLIADCK